MEQIEFTDGQQNDARAEVEGFLDEIVDCRKLQADLDPRTRVGFRPYAVFDLQFGGDLETIRDVGIEKRHEALLIEGTAGVCVDAIQRVAGSDAAVLERPVLKIHVAAHRCFRRRNKWLGIDEFSASGAAKAQSGLAILLCFEAAFIGFVLLDVAQLLFHGIKPPFQRVKFCIAHGHGIPRTAEEHAHGKRPDYYRTSHRHPPWYGPTRDSTPGQ